MFSAFLVILDLVASFEPKISQLSETLEKRRESGDRVCARVCVDGSKASSENSSMI